MKFFDFLKKSEANLNDYVVGYDENGNYMRMSLADLRTFISSANGQSMSVQYSANGETWHNVYNDGDVSMRIKVGSGSWSSNIRIKGNDGVGGQYAFVSVGDDENVINVDCSVDVCVVSVDDYNANICKTLNLINKPTVSKRVKVLFVNNRAEATRVVNLMDYSVMFVEGSNTSVTIYTPGDDTQYMRYREVGGEWSESTQLPATLSGLSHDILYECEFAGGNIFFILQYDDDTSAYVVDTWKKSDPVKIELPLPTELTSNGVTYSIMPCGYSGGTTLSVYSDDANSLALNFARNDSKSIVFVSAEKVDVLLNQLTQAGQGLLV